MTLRTATVLGADRVSIPNSGEEAWQVVTDYRPEREAGFYLRFDGPKPPDGVRISYGDQHATWAVDGSGMQAHKVGYNFDPYAPLR